MERGFGYSLDILAAKWSCHVFRTCYRIGILFQAKQGAFEMGSLCFEMGSRLLLKVLGSISNVEGWCRFLHTIKQGFDTAWVSYESTQLWHHLPRESIRSHRIRAESYKTVPPPPVQTPFTSRGVHLCLLPTTYRSEVPMTPSLCLINLLEWLTELREAFYLLDYSLTVRGYNSGTAR